MASRQRLLTCPCGVKVRCSRATMPRVTVTCEAGHVLAPADPADDRAIMDMLELTRPKVRRVRRSGWGQGQPRCVACRKFIAHPRAECRCGFDNGAGRYAASAPF